MLAALAALLLSAMTDPHPPRAAADPAATASPALPTAAAATTPAMPTTPTTPTTLAGPWAARLDCPGGALAFGLELAHDEDAGWTAWLINGTERIPVPRVEVDDDALLLGIDHYDSTITTRYDELAGTLDGTWRKRRGPDLWAELPFHARRDDQPGIAAPRPGPDPALSGRWRVQFESDEQPAVGLFEVSDDGAATGTFLTTTGDYRFLAGWQAGADLMLSCFDGAHAFLFEAVAQADGSLAGHFWSGDRWHETWTAVRDATIELPDGFTLTKWTDAATLSELVFPDLDGTPRALDDPAFAGKARILQVFGSWCPNCHDASDLMAELQRTYGPRGLSVVGLAFELSGESDRDAAQVRRYAERHHVTYPLLVAGLSDKAAAGRALPVLDAVRSYPTTVFLHGDGRVRAVYQGFSGPATGAAHERLRAAFTAIVEELLAED